MSDVGAVVAVFDHAPFGVAVLDRARTFVYVNQAMAGINRRAAAIHAGADPRVLFGPTADPWLAFVDEVFVTGHPIPSTTIKGSGHLAESFDVAYFPVIADDGAVEAVVVIVRDVTAAAAADRRADTVTRTVRALAAAGDQSAIAAAVVDHAARGLADRAAFALHDDDVSSLVALRGYPEDMAERWPPAEVDVDDPRPVCGNDVDGRPVVAVPVIVNGKVVGSFQLGWNEARDHDADIELMVTVASAAASALRRVMLWDELQQDRFRRVLNASLDDVAIAVAIRDAGVIVDFEVVYVSDRSLDGIGRGADEMLGRRVLDLYPACKASGLFDTFVDVVETGKPFSNDAFHFEDVIDGVPVDGWWRMQVVRFGDGYIANTQHVTEQVLAQRELERVRIVAASERHAVELLQEVALPLELPELAGVTLAARYVAADQHLPVGGDWYDAFVLDDGRLGLVVGDVAGHGHTSAATMLSLRHLVAVSAATGESPARVLRLAQQLGRLEPFTTCCYAVIDLEARTVTVASAGHPPPVLVHGGQAAFVDVQPAPPLGVAWQAPILDITVGIPAAATLVLYTDGLVERRDEPLDDGLADLLGRVGDDPGDPDELCRRLTAAADRRGFEDDLCVLVCSIGPPDGR